MVLSMTAFGRVKRKIGLRLFHIEIHSVNRKGLDIGINLPSELAFADMMIREKISKKCERGQVIVKIIPENAASDRISEETCAQVYKSLERVAKGLNKEFSVTFEQVVDIAMKYGTLFGLPEEQLEKDIAFAIDEAIHAWLLMKQEEGKALAEDIKNRMNAIEKALVLIEEEGKSAPDRFRQKIHSRLAELGAACGAEEGDRLAREIVFFAEKVDIAEEVIRMKSHISQTRRWLMTGGGKSIGRELQFLMQEMMREMNTIAAKSSELGGINEAIFVRVEIEKFKEQVQNIE